LRRLRTAWRDLPLTATGGHRVVNCDAALGPGCVRTAWSGEWNAQVVLIVVPLRRLKIPPRLRTRARARPCAVFRHGRRGSLLSGAGQARFFGGRRQISFELYCGPVLRHPAAVDLGGRSHSGSLSSADLLSGTRGCCITSGLCNTRPTSSTRWCRARPPSTKSVVFTHVPLLCGDWR
jgi:hypothetical protein